MNPIYLIILSAVLLIQSPRSVECISLHRLCGRFGHTCFGANWGKRELPDNRISDLNENQNDVLNELRSELFRKRPRQFFQLD